jgi:hypothetical protein
MMSNKELWAGYQSAKAKFKKASEIQDFQAMQGALSDAAHFAHTLDRPDIEAWQYNNIGYYTIMEFKQLVDYDSRITQLEKLPPSPGKSEYLKEIRRLFRNHTSILSEGLQYLEKAKAIDEVLDPSDRTEKIKNNQAFILWVLNFIESDSLSSNYP